MYHLSFFRLHLSVPQYHLYFVYTYKNATSIMVYMLMVVVETVADVYSQRDIQRAPFVMFFTEHDRAYELKKCRNAFR